MSLFRAVRSRASLGLKGCVSRASRLTSLSHRAYSTEVATENPTGQPLSQSLFTKVPVRKQLKEQAKLAKQTQLEDDLPVEPLSEEKIKEWELTVGIEIHAQLNTRHKLFSDARTATEEEPNTLVALFDMAMPGSQPIFQQEVLVPAIRAAAALNCQVQRKSKFDRKHYFYHDQPSGYQITQYYEPFARDGSLNLKARDGIAPEDGEEIEVGIKQIQLEQDTAKTIQQPPDHVLIDFNRVGHPLIEIISLPHIHHPKTAAAYVRKISQILQSVNAVTTGLELGGLRADVNVSVRLRSDDPGPHSYSGVHGLGQRTEIKNLSSFKAVEDAIVAERNRQITSLENGRRIDSETRGWTLGSTETVRLRGKEGEVDYRYMPDPDIPPLTISPDVVNLLTKTLPAVPDEQIELLTSAYGISELDAKTLISDDSKVECFHAVQKSLVDRTRMSDDVAGTLAANWVLHELGARFTAAQENFDDKRVEPEQLASLLEKLHRKVITRTTAKDILVLFFNGDPRSAQQIIQEQDLAVKRLSDDEYLAMAMSVVDDNADIAEKIRQGQQGKKQFLIGQMMRRSQGKMNPEQASNALDLILAKRDAV